MTRTVGDTASPGRSALAPLPAILLVDPDPDARAMLRDALLEGARPSALRAASDTAEMAAWLEEADAPPSLVLVDLDLPDDEAIDAIRRLKSDPERRRVPVIALTRRSDPRTIVAAYDAGANTVLPRPVTFLALVRLMKVFTAYWFEAAALPPEPA
jgi:two-component system response regulator